MRIAIITLVALALAGAAQATGTKTVKDWTAVCDNLGHCAAFGFPTDDGGTPSWIEIQRGPGAGAAPTVTIQFDVGDTQPDQTWTLSIDGHPVAGVPPVKAAGGDGGARAKLSGPAVEALVAAARNGQSLDLVTGGKSVMSISLAGSAAILLWVDDQQGRLNTVGALVARGSMPDTQARPPGEAPLIAVAGPISQAGLPKHAPKSLIKLDQECELNPGDTDPDDIVARLAPGVVLWGPECEMAAYNEGTIYFIGDEHAQHLRRITFPDADGGKPEDELINSDYDPKTRTISEFSKARGLGDCGEAADWVWDGKEFKLLDEQVMPQCNGVTQDDWPSLYVAHRK